MRTRQARKSHPQVPRVTSDPSRVIPTKASTAARELVGSTHFPLAKFDEVLSAFGELPESGQRVLATRLIHASENYRFRRLIEKQRFPTEDQKQKQLKGISASAKRLLKLLGVTNSESVASAVTLADLGSIKFHSVTTTSILTGLYRVAVERRPQIEVDAWDRLKGLLLLLSDLVAITAHVEEAPRKPKVKAAEGELIYEIIDVYAELRFRFPESGAKPGFGAQMKTFVRSCLGFAISTVVVTSSNGVKYQRDQSAVDHNLVTRITDDGIRGILQSMEKCTNQNVIHII